MSSVSLGPIGLLGSGETSLAGGRLFEAIAQNLPRPLNIAILETPAGFELNSEQVAGRVSAYLQTRLQNYNPQIAVIPARKRGLNESPDNPAILEPLRYANLIFMGPGSPTYAIRQLQNSLAWDILRARHRQGAALVFASAAVIAIGEWALPVYEVFKVGQDVHVVPGLNLFADYGLRLSLLPHWNNTDGGSEVDTSRCFIGMERFAQWHSLVPANNVVLGLDEHTGILLDFEKRCCTVSGVSSVTLLQNLQTEIFPSGTSFPLDRLGNFKTPETVESGLSAAALDFLRLSPDPEPAPVPTAEVLALAQARQQARLRKDWAEADRLRAQIATLGWTIQDTPAGPKLIRMDTAEQ
jgi:hypothetical protein